MIYFYNLWAIDDEPSNGGLFVLNRQKMYPIGFEPMTH